MRGLLQEVGFELKRLQKENRRLRKEIKRRDAAIKATLELLQGDCYAVKTKEEK